jgi:hypothetical protein
MRWGQHAEAPLTGDAPTAARHFAQPTPNAATCALRHSAVRLVVGIVHLDVHHDVRRRISYPRLVEADCGRA